ncbi:hypothetical protein ABT147_44065 [Streptomyces sp. NPDC001868]|uniref:hypothetical protein n=1 Tax=Streptomyces sp. NPDC001868 TaxID=3154401 RepID=UPI00332BBF12
MLAALKPMGLLGRLPTEQEWENEEKLADEPEIMRLQAARMLAGSAEAQVFLSLNARHAARSRTPPEPRAARGCRTGRGPRRG